MRLLLYFFVFSVLGALVQSGCNSTEQKNKTGGPSAAPIAAGSPATPPTADGTRRVTPAELKDLLDKNQAVVIDVRNEASYNTAHISGARLIPEADILKHINSLPKDKLIVTYCA